MDILQQFYENKLMRETVEAYLVETLKGMALEKLFRGEDAKPTAEAKEVVEQAFSKLRDKFEPVKKPKNTNKAR